MKPLEVVVKRTDYGEESTAGVLSCDGDEVCYTLEDKVREVAGAPVEQWKVPKQTAIPVGRYLLSLSMSNRFKRVLPELHQVPGYSGVRIHTGNTDEDTEGCILVGTRLTQERDQIAGGTSRPAMLRLMQILEQAEEDGREMWLTVS